MFQALVRDKARSPPVDLDADSSNGGFSSSASSSASFAFCCGDASKPCEQGDINAAIKCLSARNERISAHLEMRQPRIIDLRRGDSLARSLQAEFQLCERLDSEMPAIANATSVPMSSSPMKRMQSPPPPDVSRIVDLSHLPVVHQQQQQHQPTIIVEEATEPIEDKSFNKQNLAGSLCSISRVWQKLKDLTITSPQSVPPEQQTTVAVNVPAEDVAAASSYASAGAESVFFTSDDSKAAPSASGTVPILQTSAVELEISNKKIDNVAIAQTAEPQVTINKQFNFRRISTDNDDSADEKFEAFLRTHQQRKEKSIPESEDSPKNERHGDNSFIVDSSVDSEENSDEDSESRTSHTSNSQSGPDGSEVEKEDTGRENAKESGHQASVASSTIGPRRLRRPLRLSTIFTSESSSSSDSSREEIIPPASRPVASLNSHSSSLNRYEDKENTNKSINTHQASAVGSRRPRQPVRLSAIFTSESSDSSRDEIIHPASRPFATASTQPKSRPPPSRPPMALPRSATTSAATTPQTQSQRRRRREASNWTPLRAVSPVRHADFLASLDEDMPDERRHPEAMQFVHKFRQRRDQLAQYLVRLFNHSAFDGLLPADLVVTWNRRLTTTAGYCKYQRRRVSDYCIGSDDNDSERNQANQPVASVGITRTCRIELSVKVCDSASRTRDTLVHELCHAACWLINGANDGHGRLWKAWTAKCARAHPSLPPIRRCHAYVVEKKFVYKCSACNYTLARHSKLVRGQANVCPRCRVDQFECLVNTPDGRKRLSQALRPPTAFARFVKDHYGTIRSARKSLNHAGVMRELSNRFRQVQQQVQQQPQQ